MSSGPSTSWTQPASAGAIRSSAVRRSVCTSGSAFSWITNDAEVWRRKRCKTPSPAPASAMKRAASRVNSVKPGPRVSITSVAVAIASGVTLVMADRPTTAPRMTSLRSRTVTALLRHVPLGGHDHLDHPPPDLLHEGHDLVELVVARHLDARVPAARLRRRLGPDPRRQRQ